MGTRTADLNVMKDKNTIKAARLIQITGTKAISSKEVFTTTTSTDMIKKEGAKAEIIGLSPFFY